MSQDKKIAEYSALATNRFRYLKTLKIIRGDDLKDRDKINDYMNLFFEFTSNNSEKSKCLEMEFKGVRQLQIGSLEGMGGYLLQIRSVKGDQLEDLNYKIVEEDFGAFSFYCRDFSAKICG